MQSRADLLKAISKLPARTPLFPQSQKQNWVRWLNGHKDYPRINSNRDARAIFNALSNSGYIIWLAAALGVEPSLIQQAIKASKIIGVEGQKAAAVRKLLPWELIENQLGQVAAAPKSQRHFVAYHNTDKRGQYVTNRTHGTFLTNKNFRAETLQGQHLWVFEGSGLPKGYRLVSHGMIVSVTRDADGQATVRFKIEGPQAPAIVTLLPWFKTLLVQQRSFANGFSSLNDAAAILGLEGIVNRDYVEEPPISNGTSTTTEALIDARKGQGRFRTALEREWDGSCAVTGCAILQMLRASHIKPWDASTDVERLDAKNGLLLSAHIDALFDKGLISFADDGKMLLSSQIGMKDKMYFRLPRSLRVKPDRKRREFLDYHRNHVFED